MGGELCTANTGTPILTPFIPARGYLSCPNSKYVFNLILGIYGAYLPSNSCLRPYCVIINLNTHNKSLTNPEKVPYIRNIGKFPEILNMFIFIHSLIFIVLNIKLSIFLEIKKKYFRLRKSLKVIF